jgi:hypothetical protein
MVVQLFGGHMAIALFEQQLRQGEALARRPQLGRAQQFKGVGERTMIAHDTHMGTQHRLV